MDFISDYWFNDLGMDEPFFLDPCENMDAFDDELAAAFGEDFRNCLSNSESNNNTNNSNSSSSDLLQRSDSSSTLCASPATVLEAPSPTFPAVSQPQPPAKRPAKQRKSNGRTAVAVAVPVPVPEHPTSAPIILNFSNSASSRKSNGRKRSLDPVDEAELFLNNEEEVITPSPPPPPAAKPEAPAKKTPSRVRPPSQTYDHIIAERKRREQLSQLFVALSTMVPGLKKMDKTSVLGDAIKYLKQLQERVNILEEQTTKQNMESVVLVRKSQLLVDDDDGDQGEGEGSSDENLLGNSHGSLPEIEARVCDRNVLIRIHCEKNKGILVNILAEIEKLKLLVTNTSVVSFGRLAFEITIVAEMESDFHTTTKGIVRTLRAALG